MKSPRLTEDDLRTFLGNREQQRVRGGRSLPSENKRVVPYGASAAHAPYIIALTGQLPSGKNAVKITRTGRHYPDKRFTNWRAKALVEVLDQWHVGEHRTIITCPVRLTCDYWPGDLRTRDVTGMLDALFHLLVYAKVLKDDGLVHDVIWRRHEMNRKFSKVVMELEAQP